jgi:hypothetical protein
VKLRALRMRDVALAAEAVREIAGHARRMKERGMPPDVRDGGLALSYEQCAALLSLIVDGEVTP